MKENVAREILEKVKRDYALMADDFSPTRNYLWPDLQVFLPYLTSGMEILDVGCGNGRLHELLKNKNVTYRGIDNCARFIQLAQEKCGPFFQLGDVLELPSPQPTFDAVFMVAVLHHVPSAEFRLKALRNVHRILKVNGLLLMSSWNLWQPKYRKYIWRNNMKKLIGLSSLDFHDCLVPWQNKIRRYCHALSNREIEQLLAQTGFKIIKNYSTENNLITIAQKS